MKRNARMLGLGTTQTAKSLPRLWTSTALTSETEDASDRPIKRRGKQLVLVNMGALRQRAHLSTSERRT